MIPDREWNRRGETEELVCAEALGFVRVLVVGVLNADADAFPSLCASERNFETGLFFLEGEEIDIGTVDGLGRRWRSEDLDGALECSGEFEFGVRPFAGLGEADLGFAHGEARGLKLTVVAQSGLDGGFEADAECRHGRQKCEKGKNFEMHEWKLR